MARATIQVVQVALDDWVVRQDSGHELALSIRENDWRASRTRSIGRVDGCGFRDDRNAFAVEEKGSGGGCRVDHGPRVVIAPVIAASMAA